MRNIKALIESGVSPESIVSEAQKSGGKEEYQAFFQKKLDKYGVKSPEDLDDDKKKAFFDEVDKEWKADKETDPDNVNESYVRPSSSASRRADGLVSIKDKKDMLTAAQSMADDLSDEGFDYPENVYLIIRMIEEKIR